MSTWCVGLARVVAALSVTSLAVCTLAEGAEFITVERRNGRWFFITPDGVAFRSRGVDWVSYDGFKDAKTGRSLYCESNDAKFAGNRLKWAEDTAAKLRKWGFNSLGGGASPEVASQGFCSPSYVQFGVFRKNGADYSIGPRFPNVFHPQWDSFCDKLAREECQGRVGDSSLMGWFLGNEFHWWGSGRGVWRFGLFNDAASAPDGHPAKAALLNFCGGTTNVADSVKEAFVTLCAERFFSVTCGAIRRYDPNHLILGCRFMGWEGGAISNVWQTASKYCDVISFNQYPRLTNGIICVRSEPFSDIISRLSHWVGGKPLMITEWSFLARDSGLPCSNGCGQRLQTQSERATAVAAFLNQIGDNPNIVGHNFFMWLDEPAGGLASGATGEDGNYGLVNAAGEPYHLVTEAFTAHFNSEK